jgi:hypothetical protein
MICKRKKTHLDFICNIHSAKGPIRKIKRKIFASLISDKGLVLRIQNEFFKLNSKGKKDIPIKNML